jgi:phosphate transport system permease protein
MAGMLVVFAVQSTPVWRHEGLEYVTGKQWHFRQLVFGTLPMLYGTLAVSGVALLFAGPMGIAAAIFMSEYLPTRPRLAMKLVVELLAGIPSVIYGLLGILFLRNGVYWALQAVGLDPLSGDSLLTAGLLLGVMILPTIVALADDALQSVPAQQRQAARSLGLTRAETILAVALPQARRGLIAALLLALGRAFGETIAVFLVVGRQDNQWPRMWFSIDSLIGSGQTITSKLGGPETNIAYGDPLHWAAMVGLGLLLLSAVVALTSLAGWLSRGDAHA